MSVHVNDIDGQHLAGATDDPVAVATAKARDLLLALSGRNAMAAPAIDPAASSAHAMDNTSPNRAPPIMTTPMLDALERW